MWNSLLTDGVFTRTEVLSFYLVQTSLNSAVENLCLSSTELIEGNEKWEKQLYGIFRQLSCVSIDQKCISLIIPSLIVHSNTSERKITLPSKIVHEFLPFTLLLLRIVLIARTKHSAQLNRIAACK